MYIHRHGEALVKRYDSVFPVVLVTGARQTGKSTLLHNICNDLPYYSFDNINYLQAVKNDVLGFLSDAGDPAVFDEIQLAPESFTSIKYFVDRNRHNGMYYLTGSQKFSLMKNVTESLAGRIGIVELLGLSNREIFQDDFVTPFLPTGAYLKQRHTKIHFSTQELWQRIQRGSYPELYCNKEMTAQEFYNAYIDTYLDKDVHQLEQVGNLLSFHHFMVALAARTGQILNIAALSREVEVDQRTIKTWLSILEASNIIYLLQPFSLNVAKRIVKSPKVYFLDTGLVCFLCGWLTPVNAEKGAMSGQLFETFVLSEIIKSYCNAGIKPPIYYYRDTNANEIDFLLYENNVLYPMEVKKTGTPDKKMVKAFGLLPSAYPAAELGEGALICNVDDPINIVPNVRAVPVAYI